MKKKNDEMNNIPHRRLNLLTGEWILVSPHRAKRPWQGEVTAPATEKKPSYVEDCYLCPGNTRANGDVNPDYKDTFVFTNDFSALLKTGQNKKVNISNLLIQKSEQGICRVVNFSPLHNLTLAEMLPEDIEKVVSVWQNEYKSLGAEKIINHVQIFENKGAMMGNSNPHPHCQIWAQESIPTEVAKEIKQFKAYYKKNGRTILTDYIKLEKKLKERVVYENSTFIALVPFWATWPYETMIAPKRQIDNILQLKPKEKKEFAEAIKAVTVKYDNLFKCSCPYSSGIHQSPTDGKQYDEFHFHMHFYPPLLRSASIKKHMVGYEMLAEPQRDITPEFSAGILKDLPLIHFSRK